MFEIKLGWNLEQDTVVVASASGWGLHCPGRIAGGEMQFAGVGCFIHQPMVNLHRESKFAERCSDECRQLRLKCRAVYRCSFFRFYFCHCPALHEQALATVERRKFM